MDQHIDGVRPQSKRIASLLPRLTTAINRKLRPQGDAFTLPASAGESSVVRRTGFDRIFKQSTGRQFIVRLQNGQAVARSRKEIETHVLLQSYLNAHCGDAGDDRGDVVHPDDFLGRSSAPARPEDSFVPARNPHISAYGDNADLVELNVPLLTPLAVDSGSEADSETTHSTSMSSGSGLDSTSQSDLESAEEGRAAASTSFAANGVPAGVPARVPADVPADVPASVPASVPAGVPASVPAGVPAGVPAVAPTTDIGSIPDGRLSAAQTQMVRFIEDRLQLSPREFLDQISRADPAVAAFFAVQSAKMLTPDGPAFPGSTFGPSLHPEVDVRGVEHSGPTARPDVQFKDPEKQAEARRKIPHGSVLAFALLADLKREMARRNQGIGNSPNGLGGTDTAVLPGLIRPSTSGSAMNGCDGSSQLSLAEEVQYVRGFLNDRALNACNPAVRLASMASANPAVAAFCGIADEMLLIKGGDTMAASCTRFPYLDSDDLAYHTPAESDSGGHWHETFLPGVQRRPQNGTNVWRYLDGSEWKPGQSKTQVMAHVAQEALRHVTEQDSIPALQTIYPLAVYELLAKAVKTTVPQHLKDAEQHVHDNVTQARARVAEHRERVVNLQKAAATERELRAQQLELKFIEEGVTNLTQLMATRNEFDPQKVLASGSVDATFTLVPQAGTALEMIRGIQENRLSMTHARQAISGRHGPGGGRDNRCWLRGSWLSLLSAATPAMLAERYLAMCKQSAPRIAATAECLHGIAARFKADPVGFLFPESKGKNWADRLGTSAFLEHGMRADGSGPQPSGPGQGSTTEAQLEQIQSGVASCFRFENPSIMRELQSVSMFSPASSDLAVALHRAFGVPALIIETGERVMNEAGEPGVLGAQIRVVAPPGSELARFVEEAARNNMPINEGSAILNELLTRFTNLPIMWLEEEHFETYLPNQIFQREGRPV